MESEECEKLYNELLHSLNKKDVEKFRKLIFGVQDNLSDIADYAEIDIDEWGNLIY